MTCRPKSQSEFVRLAGLGLVGMILASLNAYGAFAWSFYERGGYETKDRTPVGVPVTILEVIWSMVTFIMAWNAESERTGPAVLAGLLGLLVAILILLAAHGVRNWVAGTFLFFVMFWGPFALEFALGLIRWLIARFVLSPYPAAGLSGFNLVGASSRGGSLFGSGWTPANCAPPQPEDQEALLSAADTPDAALQVPPPYENAPSFPAGRSATHLRPLGGTHGVPSKTVGPN